MSLTPDQIPAPKFPAIPPRVARVLAVMPNPPKKGGDGEEGGGWGILPPPPSPATPRIRAGVSPHAGNAGNAAAILKGLFLAG